MSDVAFLVSHFYSEGISDERVGSVRTTSQAAVMRFLIKVGTSEIS